jgi:hypothetical protein
MPGSPTVSVQTLRAASNPVNGNIKAWLRRGRGYRDMNYLLLKAQRLAVTKSEFLVLQKAALYAHLSRFSFRPVCDLHQHCRNCPFSACFCNTSPFSPAVAKDSSGTSSRRGQCQQPPQVAQIVGQAGVASAAVGLSENDDKTGGSSFLPPDSPH